MEAVIVSQSMRLLMTTVERVARSMATVLISGESGTGKELVARALHHYSMRSHRPWVDLSCAALPDHLLESELFGYDKGAFSGADANKPGLFELAHTGTIFLDEIGELDPRMQVKLLRVLDGAPYYRLGGVRKVAVDVRVVAASNRNLKAAVKQGHFRRDLYHRLSQFTITVPPLRERVEDIAPLARHFLAQHDPRLSLTGEAVAALEAQHWSGNIRELRNSMIKVALIAEGTSIHARDIPHGEAAETSTQMGRKTPDNLPDNLHDMERRAIFDALDATGGHQLKAAARLGISRRTLHRKLKLYGPDLHLNDTEAVIA